MSKSENIIEWRSTWSTFTARDWGVWIWAIQTFKTKELGLNWSKICKQREVWRLTYREDGNKNANTTKNSITNGVSLFSGVADGLVRTVKPAMVRLYGASLNDQERQASYKRHKERGERRERKKERKRGGGEERKHKSTRSVTQT